MHYRITLAALALACAAVAIGVPGAVAEKTGLEPGTEDNGLSICEESYLALYEEAHAEFGSAAVGANVVDDGTGQHAAYDLPESLCEQKAATLDAMLHPPAPEPAPATAAAPVESGYAETTTSGASGGYSIPADIVECESGGDYSAVNPSSGAYGAYQIMPSTSAAYGCDMGSAAGQDACAAEIYADVGGSAWVC